MLQLHYLEFAEKQLSSLNLDSKKDIIRLEKILKAESKINPDFNINAIEALILFLNTYGTKFIPLLKHKNMATILKAEGDHINPAPIKEGTFDELLLVEFREVFEENILAYLKSCVNKNNWVSIKSVFKIYPFLLTDYISQEIIEAFNLKNQAIIAALKTNGYPLFVAEHAYASDVAYFALLSEVDEYFFDDQILMINNIIADRQRDKMADKVALGKVLYAASYYNAFSSELALTLESNQGIAHDWVYPGGEKPVIWTTSNVIALVIAILIAVVILAFLPTNIGGIAWISIIMGRLAFTLLKK